LNLLVADLHLDDNPLNEYRWKVFDSIVAHKPKHVFILGDLCHKKDRHSALLVNRLTNTLSWLVNQHIRVTILCGNHDEPLKGPPYWYFLNNIPYLNFVVKPTAMNDSLLLLPHSNDPTEEWSEVDLSHYKGVFMHQPVSGADLGNGMKINTSYELNFPEDIHVYSGDLHFPQRVRGVEYIGTPHPVAFGEHHVYRMLLVNDAWELVHQIELHPPEKYTITVHSIEELQAMNLQQGDQAKIEFVLPAARVEQWPVEQAAITAWANTTGVTVAAVKTKVETTPDGSDVPNNNFLLPIDVLVGFADAEGIEEPLLITGYNLLEEALAEKVQDND
jgi:hypothetical protein